MPWFEKEMDYARASLEKVSEHAIDRAAERLAVTLRSGIDQASQEIRAIVTDASRDVDAKLDKISEELHHQRQFTKSDVKELVDYAADKLGATIDARVAVMKREITELVQDKVEYFKREVDAFFIKRQEDLARERRRLYLNVFIAVLASFLMGGVSLMYTRMSAGTLDLFGVFRIVFMSLAAGYGVYLVVSLLRRYRQMAEHKKDLMFLTMKYWGVLRPESVFAHLFLIALLAVVYVMVFFPDWLPSLTGSEWLRRWSEMLHGR